MAYGAGGHVAFFTGCHVSTRQQEYSPTTTLTYHTRGEGTILRGGELREGGEGGKVVSTIAKQEITLNKTIYLRSK